MGTTTRPRLWAGLLLGLWGCGGGAIEGSTGAGAPGAAPSTIAPSSGGAAVGPDAPSGGDDVRALLVDAVAPHLCESMRGSFIGLPGEGGSAGVAAGSDPTAGRWWIRTCESRVDGDRLSLSITGTGWTWVDRESMGFRIRQYLRFDARAAFTAAMDVGYDRSSRIATVWMRPGPDVSAAVEPRGLVRAEATNVVSGILGGLLALGGASPSERAQQQVADEGSATLRARFATGFTVTFSMASEQMDFMVGALGRGEVPVRPYPPEAGVVWSVNQRLSVWPGGLDVLGPLADGRGPQALDLGLEEGEGVVVDALCADTFGRYYDQSLQGGTAAPPVGVRVTELAAAGQSTRAQLPSLGCPTLLLVTPRPSAVLPVRLRVRVAPGTVARAEAASAPRAGASTASGVVARGDAAVVAETGAASSRASDDARSVRIQVAGMSLSPVSGTGGRWDLIGSEPDPYVVIVSVPAQREVERTTVVADRHELGGFEHWLPGAFRRADLPLRFSVFDDDVGADELIGIGDLSAASLEPGMDAPGELTLQLRTAEPVPRPMGSLRLRLQPVQ